MRERSYLSLLAALCLTFGTVAAAPSAWGAGLNDEGAAVVSLPAEASESESRKGNGFVRAITAPFRALGRLFGGGKTRGETAKKKETEKRRGDRVGASVGAAVAAETPRRKETVEERRAAPAARPRASDAEPAAVGDNAKSTPARVATPAPGVAVAPSAAVSPAAGAHVVRPSEGRPAQLKPPKWVPVIEGIGRDPLTQGRALLRHGYPNEAISELSIAAVTGPDLVEANNLLGLAYDRLGLHKQAIASYERALSAMPDDPQVLNNLGYSLFLDDRHAEALKRLRRAERRAPGSPTVLQNIAFVQARLGKYGDAFKSLSRAFGEYDARLKTAELLEQAGRDDDALKHYEAALRLQPNSPALLERLVAVYERRGRTRDAEAARRALGNPPNKQKTATGGGG